MKSSNLNCPLTWQPRDFHPPRDCTAINSASIKGILFFSQVGRELRECGKSKTQSRIRHGSFHVSLVSFIPVVPQSLSFMTTFLNFCCRMADLGLSDFSQVVVVVVILVRNTRVVVFSQCIRLEGTQWWFVLYSWS